MIHTDFLDKVGGFFDDFVKSRLGPFGCVHLIDGDNELFDTECISKQSMFTSLSVLGNTSFEFTDTGSDNNLNQTPKQGEPYEWHNQLEKFQ